MNFHYVDLLAVVSLVTWFGCAPPPAATPSPEPPFSGPDPSALASVVLAPPPVDPALAGFDPKLLPPTVPAPRNIACTLTEGRVAASLSFGPGQPPYAKVPAMAVDRVQIPVGENTVGALLYLAAEGVRLRGYVTTSELPLYPALPVVVPPSLRLDEDLQLRWERGTLGKLVVSFALDRRVRLLQGQARTELSCEQLALTVGVGTYRPTDNAKLLALPRRAIMLSEQAGGRPVVRLSLGAMPGAKDEAPPTAYLLAKRGRFRQITWHGTGHWVTGWTAAALRELISDWFSDAGLGLDPLDTGLFGGSPGGSCAWNAPLIAEHRGLQYVVGTVSRGVRFEVVGLSGAFAHIELGLAATGARLFVPKAFLYDCRRGRKPSWVKR